MSHRHITTSSSYQFGDTVITASPATDSPNQVVYTLPSLQDIPSDCRIEFFNVITPSEFHLEIDANGGQIDCMGQGGTLGGLTISAGRGAVVLWIPSVGRWVVVSTS